MIATAQSAALPECAKLMMVLSGKTGAGHVQGVGPAASAGFRGAPAGPLHACGHAAAVGVCGVRSGAGRVQAVEEEAEAVQAELQLPSHPLLSRPSSSATIAPSLPSRLFIPTRVNPCHSPFQGRAHACSLPRSSYRTAPAPCQFVPASHA